MKLRHLLPWIPIIGFIWVALFSQYFYKKQFYKVNFVKYIWGSRTSYFLTMICQQLSFLILIWYFLKMFLILWG